MAIVKLNIKALLGRREKDSPLDPEQIRRKGLPQHIAIIMDGNGRWARARKLPRVAGHRAGMENLKTIVQFSKEIGIKHLTVYAFSTENWKRPKEEVEALMNLLVEYIEKELAQLCKNGVKLRIIGLEEGLPDVARKHIQKAVQATEDNHQLYLQIALNYGGRSEIVQAVKRVARDIASGKISQEGIDESLISTYLDTAGLPDPDLIIRPSGELRISNFLLWQSAYAEFWVTNVCWPDFNSQHLLQAIQDYQNRHRRYGGI